MEKGNDDAVVGEDRLPREGPNQVRDEERRDHEQEEEVLPPPTAKRDPVRERVTDRERDRRRGPRVLERADELRLVGGDGVAEVPPRPAEAEEREEPLLEGHLPEVVHRHDEEDEQPRHPRGEERIRRQPSAAMEEPPHYAPMRCWNRCLYFGLFTAVTSNWYTFASISFVGKMSGFFAMAGSLFSSTLSAPTTGLM